MAQPGRRATPSSSSPTAIRRSRSARARRPRPPRVPRHRWGASRRAMSQENVEIVRTFLRAGVDEALEYADPGIVWNPIEELPTQGHDAVRASLAHWKGEWHDYELLPEEFVDIRRPRRRDGPIARARARKRGRGRRPLLRRLHAPRRQDRPHGPVHRALRGPRSRGAAGVGDVAGERGGRCGAYTRSGPRGDFSAGEVFDADVEFGMVDWPGRDRSRGIQEMARGVAGVARRLGRLPCRADGLHRAGQTSWWPVLDEVGGSARKSSQAASDSCHASAISSIPCICSAGPVDHVELHVCVEDLARGEIAARPLLVTRRTISTFSRDVAAPAAPPLRVPPNAP